MSATLDATDLNQAPIVPMVNRRTAAAQADLAALAARQTDLAARRDRLTGEIATAEQQAVRAVMTGGERSSPAKLARLRDDLAATNSALTLLADQEAAGRRAVEVARLADNIELMLRLDRTLTEREARRRELFRPLAEYEGIEGEPPNLYGSITSGLFSRWEQLNSRLPWTATRMGVDFDDLCRTIAAELDGEQATEEV